MIWLVDYTHYKQEIDEALQQYKRDYFRMKSYRRHQVIGQTAPVKNRVFGTGLLRIATLLHKNGYPVRYLHYEMLEAALVNGEKMPEIVAFSCVCPTAPRCAELCTQIKMRSPNTMVMLGGVHVNVALDETKRRFPMFDRFITGYETAAAEQIVQQPLQNYTDRYVDYSLLPYPLSDYAINTLTTMGCPFRCRYCVDGIAPHFCACDNGQLDDMTKLLPARNLVHIFDSVLGHSEKRIREVCKAIKATGHQFLLSCDMRADLMTPELVRLIEDAGFVELRLGMESADTELLQENGRTLSFERFIEKLTMIRQNSKLYIALYTVTGLPGTTWEVQEKTLQACDYLLRSGLVDEIKNAMYVPYPMAHIDYTQQGITILNNDWAQYDRQSFPVYRTKEMSSEELWHMYLETARRINESWLKALGFSNYDEIPEIPGYYSEYVERNYLDK